MDIMMLVERYRECERVVASRRQAYFDAEAQLTKADRELQFAQEDRSKAREELLNAAAGSAVLQEAG